MFTVFGATGNTGSAVARTLLDHGKKIRVVVRDVNTAAPWRERGADVVVGTLSDERVIESALRDVEGAYLLLPPDWSSNAVVKGRATTSDLLSSVIARAKPRRVVFLSSYASYNFGELYAEEKIGPMAGVTFLRASYFMNNWGGVLAAAKTEGVLPTFLRPDRKVPTVWADDIGVTAAQLLMAAAAPDKMVEFTGPQEYSADDVAEVLSSILGKKVKPVALPNDAVVPTFTGMGISHDFSELFRRFYADIDSGKVKWQHPQSVMRGQTTIESALRRMLNV
ncbi:MAG: NmrA family NAD(P)-binding protein [Gammaproteobacteria bacterium]|nr:NmrA family NAD(P)-binding protein [Gammaproteobacteria bacterium]